ncbi:MAG: hypothetical protein LHV68_08360 [Elusimicrobia bacterium]|nr:hypothetical protein [Candidatus Liberimonas magnetica]
MYVEIYTDAKSMELAHQLIGQNELPKGIVVLGLVKRNSYTEGACLKYETGEMVSYNNGKISTLPKSNQIDIK